MSKRAIVALCAVALSGCTSLAVRVEYDGNTYPFAHCTVRSETQSIELRDANGAVHVVPGRNNYPHVVCSRPLTTDKTFWQWRKQVEQGTVTRKTVTIVYLDWMRRELARFTIFRAWPAAAQVNGDQIEQVELAHEGLQRE